MARNGNQSALAAAFPGVISYGVYASLKSSGADPVYLYMFGGSAAFCGALATLRVLSNLRQWLQLKRMLKPQGIYGTTRPLNDHDPEEFGLKTCNWKGDGIVLGAKTGAKKPKLIYYDGDGHGIFVGGTGAGKTASLTKPIRLGLGAHRNAIITAKGEDMAVSLFRFLNEVLGQDVVCIDPYRLLRDHGIKSDDYNACDILVELAEEDSPEILEKAHEIALIILPEPADGGGGENKVFRDMGRNFIAGCLMFLALEQAETGELCCNLGYLQATLTDGMPQLLDFFSRMSRCDAYDGTIARSARAVISKIKTGGIATEEFFTEAQNALRPFAPITMIGRSMEYSSFKARDLKTPGKKMTVFIVLPPEKSEQTSIYAGLCLNMLITQCIEANRFEPRVTVIADEFENLSQGPLPIIERVLIIGRTRGVQLLAFVQAITGGLDVRYKGLTSMFQSQSAIFMAFDVRDESEAERFSKRAGKRSIVKPSGNMGEETFSLGLQEEGIDLMRIDQFTQMPKFKAVLFKEQNPPMMLDLVHYKQVKPWADQVDPVPGVPEDNDMDIRFDANEPRQIPLNKRVRSAISRG